MEGLEHNAEKPRCHVSLGELNANNVFGVSLSWEER
jgi:hypothetical protein